MLGKLSFSLQTFTYIYLYISIISISVSVKINAYLNLIIEKYYVSQKLFHML